MLYDDTHSYGIPEKAKATGTQNCSVAHRVSTGAQGEHTGRCDCPAPSAPEVIKTHSECVKIHHTAHQESDFNRT